MMIDTREMRINIMVMDSDAEELKRLLINSLRFEQMGNCYRGM